MGTGQVDPSNDSHENARHEHDGQRRPAARHAAHRATPSRQCQPLEPLVGELRLQDRQQARVWQACVQTAALAAGSHYGMGRTCAPTALNQRKRRSVYLS